MTTVIRVDKLTKEYRLGTISHGTLKEDLESWWARLRGKEDPNSLITLNHSTLNPQPSTGSSHPSTLNSQQALNPHFLALNNVSFDVQKGEAVGIIGRNGAGKSTLLKILSRVTAPTRGVVKIKGRVASLLEVGTGFHPELTGRENIFLNGTIHGMKRAEIQRKLDEIIAFAEINQFIDTPVKRYSSGMYVRLGFAVAAHLDPEILIVDEVLAVGDFQFQKKCLGKMQDVGREGRTVLFVSHQMESISNLCTRAILLQNGALVESGPTRAVVESYLQSAQKLDTTPMMERIDRSGNGRIRFTATWTENAKGEKGVPVLSGKDLSIVATYELQGDEKISGVRVAFGLMDKIGTQFTDLTNTLSGDHFELQGKRGEFRCTIPRLPLNTGRYSYHAFVCSSLGTEDFVLDAGFFEVEVGDFYVTGRTVDQQQGTLLIDQHWSVC